MAASEELARKVVEAGRSCSLTTAVLEEWSRLGTPKQAGYLAGYLEAERSSREASKRATLLRRCALPAPKTFDGYDWSAVSWPEGMGRESLLALDFVERREDLVLMGDVGTGKTHMASALCALACERRLEGRDAAALGKLPSLADLYAHRNVAFVGPGGIGKTHLAQAYGRECCMRGLKTYYIKATELRDRFQKAVQRGNTSRVVSSLVKPSCLIVDEVGRCVYDRPCTDLFFDVVDRRYEKEGPNAMVLTSNIAPSGWDEFFTGDDTLLCALDRLFDKASVFVMRGPSYRGRGLDTYSVEAVPQAVKVRGIQPEGM